MTTSAVFGARRRLHKLAGHWPAALFLAAYALLACAYSWFVPLGETPDEIGHFQFVRYVADRGRLPVQELRPGNEVGEGHQAPLFYILGGLATAGIDAADVATLRNNPDMSFAVDQVGNKHVHIHTLAETWPPTGYALAWRVARLLSIGAGLLAGALAYLFALTAFRGSRPEATFALAFLALNPQWVFISAGIGTDSLAAAAGGALLLTTAGLLVRPRATPWQAVWLGLAVGVALLTKLTLGVLIGICFGAVALRLRGNIALLARRTMVAGGTALAVAGWWLARNLWLYGDPFALNVDRAQNPSLVGAGKVDIQLLRSLLLTVRDSYFARFGWMNIAPPLWVYDVVTVVLSVAAAGIALWLALRLTGRTAVTVSASLLGLSLASVLGFLIALLVFAIGKGPSGYQGRYLFPVAAAVSVCLATGLLQWVPARRRWWAVGALGAVGIGVCVYSLWQIVVPAYPSPLPIYPPSRAVTPELPLDARYDRGITLLAGAAVPSMLILLGLELSRFAWSRQVPVLVASIGLRLLVGPLVGSGLAALALIRVYQLAAGAPFSSQSIRAAPPLPPFPFCPTSSPTRRERVRGYGHRWPFRPPW